MAFHTIQSLRIKVISTRKIQYALLFFVFTGCGFDKFPVTIYDIDTLTVYQNHMDSISQIIQEEKIHIPDSISINADTVNTTGSTLINEISWTLCSGTFKEKRNAQRMFQKLNQTNNAFNLQRDSFFIVTLEIFQSKDSALAYRKKINFTESYPLRVHPGEILKKELPD